MGQPYIERFAFFRDVIATLIKAPYPSPGTSGFERSISPVFPGLRFREKRFWKGRPGEGDAGIYYGV